ncbi:MAG: acyl-CoA dehydrogenase family protein [Nocardiopsaceae bacterium]|nr:acyl-CoA dehydrogenase family protein [Nocardiopsaceae bacterium]
MDFSLTQTQQELSALARRILTDKETPERLAELDRAGLGFDESLWSELAATGILSAVLPENSGGDGLEFLEQCSVLIELGRTVARAPYLTAIVLGASAIARFGSAEQVSRWAGPAGAGELIIATALAEVDGEDPRHPKTVAEPEGGPRTPSTIAEHADARWRLSGSKTAVPFGTVAHLFLVPATTPYGTSVFCVQPTDPGVTVEPQELTDGPGFARVTLEGAELGSDQLLASGNEPVAGWLADRATVGICAAQLGVAERALELTSEHARTRQQFGRPIGAFQAVAQRLADAYIDVEAIRLTMWQAAWRLEAGLPADEEIATAKFCAADGGHRVAHTAVHIHGGVGVDTSHSLHRYFTAAKQNEFALGGATTQLRRLGGVIRSAALADG